MRENSWAYVSGTGAATGVAETLYNKYKICYMLVTIEFLRYAYG